MNGAWWQGTRLVAERGLLESLRSRSVRVVTALLLLLSVAAVVVPQLLDDDATTYTLVTVGTAPAGVAAILDAAATTSGFDVEYVTRGDEDAVRLALRDGEATAGLVDDTLYTSTDADGTFPVLVAQAVVALETSQRLAAAGLSPDEVARIQSVQPPTQVAVGRVDDTDRAGIGFAVGIVLYLALMFAGSSIAGTVAMEKSTRISEVLLAVLRPSQVLVGTVAAVGIVTFAQLVVLATPLAVAVQVTEDVGLPSAAAGDIVLAVVWFVLGFALYAFLFAASAALVDKVTEVGTAIMPVTMTLIAGYLLAVTVVPANPNGGWSVAASIFPLTAPMAMPIRWAAGDVPAVQLALAMVLTAASAVLVASFAATVYRRALLITGRRVALREVVTGRTAG